MGWIRRLRASLSRSNAADPLDDELRFHLEERTAANIRAGMTPSSARRAAARRFCSVTFARERTRDADTVRWLTDLGQDIRYSARTLRKSPAFAITAILTLALGIGANTAAFGLLNDYLRPLPVPDADRIVVLAAGLPGDETGLAYRFSYAALADYRAQADTFSDVFGFDIRDSGLTIDGKTSPFVHQMVTGNLFSGLRLNPVAGRLFQAGEGEHPGDDSLIVLGYNYWQTRLGGDPRAVGTIVRLDGRPSRVIGVTPEGFHGLFQGAEMDGYSLLAGATPPVDFTPLLTDRGIRSLTMVARLRAGISVPAAQAAASLVAKRLADEHPETDGHTTVRVLPETLARPVPLPSIARALPAIRILTLALASLVLLIACVNVANLLLARATVRQREMAVRAALGSSGSRLIRLSLVEGLLLAAIGTAAGVVAGRWAIDLLVGSIDVSASMPFRFDTHVDWRVFAYATALAVATGALVSAAPALRASGVNVSDLLHEGGRSETSGARQRVRRLLVVAQVAGSLMLLIVAGLFVRNFERAEAMDLGFSPDHVWTARLNPHQLGYDQARTKAFYDELDRRIHAIPGVQSAATAFTVPMSFIIGDGAPIVAEGAATKANEPQPATGYNTVSPEYFSTLGLPLARGRAFTEHDDRSTPRVAIVNETLARRLWPNQDPIGKRFAFADDGHTFWEVVGVARDSKYVAVYERPLPHFYLPLAQVESWMRALIIRSTLEPDVLRAAVERDVAALDSDMPLADVYTMAHILSGNFSVALLRIGAVQAAGLGLLGLLLAIVGVYGVVSYGANQRTREIGIRLALGATPRDVRRLVVGDGAKLVALGVALGLVATFAAARALAGLLVLVSTTDLLTFTIVPLALAAVALTACYLPTRRAVRVDPIAVLRAE